MEKANGLVWEVSFGEFLLVTLLLAGGAAWMTGRATARGWSPHWQLAIYLVLLTAATRFIHFALFSGTLLSPWYFVVDLLALFAIGFLGNRFTRSSQMATQYSFAFDRASPFSFRRR
jgi:hypothetical protein